MRIIGFNFDKISIERSKTKPETLKINTNIDISEIKEAKTEMIKAKEALLNVSFSYGVKYDPGYATVDLRGNIILALDAKTAEEVLREWKKKKMPQNFQTILFNVILRKSTVKALQLEDELALPLHMPFPTIKPGNSQ